MDSKLQDADFPLASDDRSYALNRAIFIDSYSRGRIIEMPLDGGGVLTGKNGQGKTTLLLTFLLFHGESPSKIVHKSTGRESFIQHYLPNTTSYIIFEYIRQPGELCLAVHSADTEGRHIQHRFVGSSYSPEMFIGENNQIIEASSLGAHLRQSGLPVSALITSQTAYRNILHNTPQRGDRSQRELAAMYSIAPHGTRLVGVERIVSGMFSRTANFEDLQKLVVKTLRDSEDVNLALMADRTKAERWIQDRRAYAAVMNLEHAYTSAEADYAAYGVSIKELLHTAARLQAFALHADKRLGSITQQIADNHEQLADIRVRERPELQDRIEDLSGLKGALKNFQKLSRAYEAQKRTYENSDIEEAARKLDSLPSLRIEVQQLSDRRVTLEGEAREIRARVDSQRKQVQDDLDNRLSQIRSNRDTINAGIQARRQEAESSYRSEEDRVRAENATELEKIGNEISDRKSAVALAKHSAENPTIDLKIREATEQAELDLRAKREAEMARRREQAEAREAYHLAQREHENSERQFELAERHMVAANEKLQKATAFVQGPRGSLLNLLRSEESPHIGALTRLLKDEVILGQKLKPRRVDQGQTVYGYELEIETIEPSPLADIESAREQLHLASQARDQAADALSDAKLHCEAKGATRNRVRRERDNADQQATVAESATTAAQTNYERALGIQQDALAKLKSAAQSHINSAKSALQVVESQKTSLVADHDRSIATIRNAHHDLLKSFDLEYQEAQQSSAEQEADAKAAAQKRHKELAEDLNDALSEAGVDPQKIAAITAEIDNNNHTIRDLENQRPRIEKWRSWRETEPAAEARRQAEISQHTTLISRHDNEIAQIRADIERREAAIAEANKQLENEQLQLVRYRETANTRSQGIQEEHGSLPELEPWRPHDDFNATLLGLTKTEKAKSESRRSLLSHVSTLENAFRAYPDTQVYEFMVKGRHQAAGSESLLGFREWYESAHEDTRRLLISQARGIADSIRGFYRQLKEFQDQTLKFNRDLQTHLGQATSFDGVDDLSVVVVSKVGELDYWDRVQTVTDSAARWLESDKQGEMPSEDFEEALASLLEIWKQSGSLQTDLKSLIRVQGEVREKGTLKKFATGKQLETVSSNGLSYLILVSIFVAFLNRIRAGAPTIITWPLDELRSIDAENTAKLVKLLAKNRIELVSAFPDPDPEIMKRFKNRFMLDQQRRLIRVRIADEEVSNVL